MLALEGGPLNKKKATNFEEFEAVLLQDSEIKKEYEALKPKYDMIQNIIKRRISFAWVNHNLPGLSAPNNRPYPDWNGVTSITSLWAL